VAWQDVRVRTPGAIDRLIVSSTAPRERLLGKPRPDHARPNLLERRLARGGRVVSKRGEAAVVGGPELRHRKNVGGFQHAIAHLFQRFDCRIDRVRHPDERLRTTYWADGGYVPNALTDINFILRDFRANEIKAIDLRLLDLLHRLNASLETSQPFHVISGYRTAATNAMLRGASAGVALHSLHIDGMAIDIRVPGHDLAVLRRAALALRGGGVGYYPQSDFVHVDVGRVRTW
jgi:uncharacterized protein YcbK (DUF882 family)